MNKENPEFKKIILEIVENQLEENNPKETGETLQRLIKSGISKKDARIYIGQAVTVEIWEVMHNNTPFNEERFVRNLKRLPKFPEES